MYMADSFKTKPVYTVHCSDELQANCFMSLPSLDILLNLTKFTSKPTKPA